MGDLELNFVGQPERATQKRVIALFRDKLGYRYLGDWTDRDTNSNVEESLLSAWLAKRAYSLAQVSVAIYKLRLVALSPLLLRTSRRSGAS